MPSQFCKPKPLTHRLTKRLLAYATMAGAGLATFASHAAAEVVYTPTHIKLHNNLFLDLNNDGLDDFRITSFDLSGIGSVQVFAIHGNRMVASNQRCGSHPHGPDAAALPEGTVIGPGKPFNANATCMAFSTSSGFGNGPWFQANEAYLGFAIAIDGKEHFGWARLRIGQFILGDVAILGYAYQTVPGKPIIAGDEGSQTEASAQPATLAVLATGAPALGTRKF
jgi:hypothetical protein